MRDYTGDGVAEVIAVTMGYAISAAEIVYQRRVQVFGGADVELGYDSGAVPGSISLASPWDTDADGVPEFQLTHYGSSAADVPWIRFYNGVDSWSVARVTLVGDIAGSDIFLYGLPR
ncbi:MAG: hypothetical protein M5R36_08850 [Deltaproteobacteria bacterium]|nr:hypothetical protein [Deltaproteobacteria bacterium]